MPNLKKQEAVTSLLKLLTDRDSVVLVDYSGLTHQQLSDIRVKVFEAGGMFQVVKNNLLLIALKDKKLPLPESQLTGPTAVLFVPQDNPSSIKVLYEQGKQLENLAIKWGIWEQKLVSMETIKQLALLPGREQLLAMLVGSLKSPQTRLVLTLKGNLQKLVIALDQIRKQKE
jgi:large subunit ribosomal protein L10